MSSETTYEKLKTKFKCLDDLRRPLMELVAEIECDIVELRPNLTGTAGRYRYDIKTGKYWDDTSTAGECTCPSTTLYPRDGMANEPIGIDVNCPVHGKSTWQKARKYTISGGTWPCSIKGCDKLAYIMYKGIKYCWKHLPSFAKFTWVRKAGECTCTHRTLPDPDCPVHGLPKVTPDPLHVRVAKSLVEKVYFGNGEWYMATQLASAPHEPENWEVERVPDYPNDLVAAMGALEEYCNKGLFQFNIKKYGALNAKYWVYINPVGVLNVNTGIDESLPQAICEAIVAHAEGE